MSKRSTVNGVHGHTSPLQGGRSPTYNSWQNMVARCFQPSNPAYAHYKRRGITVCEKWRKFENFLADMGERPAGDRITLDRINNNGDYEPGNVKWATKTEQANNRITNVLFTYQGHEYTLANLARKTGVQKDLLRERLCRSALPWTVEGAIKTPTIPREKRKMGFYC